MHTDTQWLAQVADTLNTAVLVLDHEHRPLYINSAAEQFLAISWASATKLGLTHFFEENPLLIDAIEEARSGPQVITLRATRLRIGHDHTRIADCAISPAPDLPGAAILMEFTDNERHLRISRDAQLHSLHQTSRQLVRGLAHELKNPLGGLRGAAQLLERELTQQNETQGLREFTQIILQETDRLRNLIDRMLGPNDRPQDSWINVHEPLEQVRQLLTIEAGDAPIHWQIDYDPSIPDIYADRDQIVQVLLNLGRNAMQAMQENQTPNPSISLRTRILRNYTIHQERHRLVVRVDIEDNGPGIPEELTESLFLPMVSGRANGTGLGLSIAQAIAERHHGIIEFKRMRQGTRFSLLLPIVEHPHHD